MRRLFSCTLVFSLFNFLILSTYPQAKNIETDLDFAIAQKIMLDLRYYCPEHTSVTPVSCFKPMTKLPDELKTMISETAIGGVILFADNLVDPEQIKQLTHDLQQAGAGNKYHTPLLISVDQEGGRVMRLPKQYGTGFSGNMAIGATYPKYGTKFATATGEVIGQELKALGFNVNHAPNVDVNVNPLNPVINVRSFSESPQQVAELGSAQLSAMQQQGIIGTLKHFPGHGDTSVDSHTGLPRVEHDLSTVKSVDLKPFQYAIDKGIAEMIMTAHIQYPALDSSTLINKQGKSMIKPATMSKAILTDLLRGEMGFNGVVITDALDMKGISDFFDETQAVVQTFKAGADIALMPLKVKNPKQISKVKKLIKDVKAAVQSKQLSKAQVLRSHQRIRNLKSSIKTSTSEETVIGLPASKALEQQLAQAALTAIKGDGHIKGQRSHIIMPDPNKCLAIGQALSKQNSEIVYTCSNYLTYTYQQTQELVEQADTLIAMSIEPKQSLAEIGGMDDLAKSVKMSKQAKWTKSERVRDLKAMMAVAKLQNKQSIFVSLRAPYEAKAFLDLADDVITTYSYTHTTHSDSEFSGPAYDALAKLLLGEIKATGSLPVTID